jgi:hypothetical protein
MHQDGCKLPQVQGPLIRSTFGGVQQECIKLACIRINSGHYLLRFRHGHGFAAAAAAAAAAADTAAAAAA